MPSNHEITQDAYTEIKKAYAYLRLAETNAERDHTQTEKMWEIHESSKKIFAAEFNKMTMIILSKDQLLFILGLARKYRFTEPFRVLMKFDL